MKICNVCKRELPAAAFMNRRNHAEETCTACRTTLKRRKRERVKNRYTSQKQELTAAKKTVRKRVDSNRLRFILNELGKERAASRHKAKKYARRIAEGVGTSKTEAALRHQQQRVGYYDELERIMRRHAREGQLYPYLAYLTNTKVKSRHGFPVVVDHNDPDWE